MWYSCCYLFINDPSEVGPDPFFNIIWIDKNTAVTYIGKHIIENLFSSYNILFLIFFTSSSPSSFNIHTVKVNRCKFNPFTKKNKSRVGCIVIFYRGLFVILYVLQMFTLINADVFYVLFKRIREICIIKGESQKNNIFFMIMIKMCFWDFFFLRKRLSTGFVCCDIYFLR